MKYLHNPTTIRRSHTLMHGEPPISVDPGESVPIPDSWAQFLPLGSPLVVLPHAPGSVEEFIAQEEAKPAVITEEAQPLDLDRVGRVDTILSPAPSSPVIPAKVSEQVDLLSTEQKSALRLRRAARQRS